MSDYGVTTADFRAGDRVELHPGCDLWMRGAMYGVVVKRTETVVWVKMDHPQVRRLQVCRPDMLRRRR